MCDILIDIEKLNIANLKTTEDNETYEDIANLKTTEDNETYMKMMEMIGICRIKI